MTVSAKLEPCTGAGTVGMKMSSGWDVWLQTRRGLSEAGQSLTALCPAVLTALQ